MHFHTFCFHTLPFLNFSAPSLFLPTLIRDYSTFEVPLPQFSPLTLQFLSRFCLPPSHTSDSSRTTPLPLLVLWEALSFPHTSASSYLRLPHASFPLSSSHFSSPTLLSTHTFIPSHFCSPNISVPSILVVPLHFYPPARLVPSHLWSLSHLWSSHTFIIPHFCPLTLQVTSYSYPPYIWSPHTSFSLKLLLPSHRSSPYFFHPALLNPSHFFSPHTCVHISDPPTFGSLRLYSPETSGLLILLFPSHFYSPHSYGPLTFMVPLYLRSPHTYGPLPLPFLNSSLLTLPPKISRGHSFPS